MKDYSDDIGYLGVFLIAVIWTVLAINYLAGDFLNIL
jgi:hypothetical protein